MKAFLNSSTGNQHSNRSIQVLHLQTNLMKKITLLALVGTGFLVTMPFAAQALNSEKIGHNLDQEPNMSIAQYNRDRYRDNRYRNRQFFVYYRSRDDRRWIFQSNHYNRRDARRAANRLERRGYRTLILG
jgi:hypothetical protein